MKNSSVFFILKYSFFSGKIFNIFELAFFRNEVFNFTQYI